MPQPDEGEEVVGMVYDPLTRLLHCECPSADEEDEVDGTVIASTWMRSLSSIRMSALRPPTIWMAVGCISLVTPVLHNDECS